MTIPILDKVFQKIKEERIALSPFGGFCTALMLNSGDYPTTNEVYKSILPVPKDAEKVSAN